MDKSENLVARLLAVYAIILTLCIAIYAIFQLLEVDLTLATNLLLWSAAIFAPIAVLMTYTSWREQKGSEILSSMSKDNYASLLALESHLIDVANSVKYQFRSWQLSENREKLFNNQYLFEIEKLKDRTSSLKKNLDMIVRYQKENIELKTLVNNFNSECELVNEGIKELWDHIGTYGNDDTYFKANYLKYENDFDMTVGEANKSSQELRNYLINLVFYKT